MAISHCYLQGVQDHYDRRHGHQPLLLTRSTRSLRQASWPSATATNKEYKIITTGVMAISHCYLQGVQDHYDRRHGHQPLLLTRRTRSLRQASWPSATATNKEYKIITTDVMAISHCYLQGVQDHYDRRHCRQPLLLTRSTRSL